MVAYAVLIFFLSSISDPSPGFIPHFFMADKLIHLIEYTLLGFLLFRAFGEWLPPRKKLILSFALASFYGFTDELHQYFVPLRDAEFMDLLADSAGALLGAYVALMIRRGGSFE